MFTLICAQLILFMAFCLPLYVFGWFCFLLHWSATLMALKCLSFYILLCLLLLIRPGMCLLLSVHMHTAQLCCHAMFILKHALALYVGSPFEHTLFCLISASYMLLFTDVSREYITHTNTCCLLWPFSHIYAAFHVYADYGFVCVLSLYVLAIHLHFAQWICFPYLHNNMVASASCLE